MSEVVEPDKRRGKPMPTTPPPPPPSGAINTRVKINNGKKTPCELFFKFEKINSFSSFLFLLVKRFPLSLSLFRTLLADS